MLVVGSQYARTNIPTKDEERFYIVRAILLLYDYVWQGTSHEAI